jgi:hypothetical protein
MMSGRAYGSRNFENYRLRVLTHCGWSGATFRWHYKQGLIKTGSSPVKWVESVKWWVVSGVKRQSSWPVVLPHLIITLSQKALPHLKDTNYNTLVSCGLMWSHVVSCGRIIVLNLAS